MDLKSLIGWEIVLSHTAGRCFLPVANLVDRLTVFAVTCCHSPGCGEVLVANFRHRRNQSGL